jgi:hypothetical protein
MSLNKMPAHPRTCRYRSLEIDIAVLLEGAEVCSSHGFRRDADLEGGLVEIGYGQASSIYADAVAQVAIGKDFGGVGDGECCTAIFGLVVEFGDN